MTVEPGSEGLSGPTPAAAEERRLGVLGAYEVLDTDAEASFDDIAIIAAQLAGTPMAAVSFVDAERQWFKSKVGLPVRETERGASFCAHAIERPGAVMVVPDAAADARFADNRLVTGAPGVRFYAGSPLVAPGARRSVRCACSTPAPASSTPPSSAAWPPSAARSWPCSRRAGQHGAWATPSTPRSVPSTTDRSPPRSSGPRSSWHRSGCRSSAPTAATSG